MKPIKLIFTVFFLLLSLGYNALAQQKDVNDPTLIAKVEADLNYVFNDYANTYVTTKNILYYTEIFTRIEIKTEPATTHESYPLLSNIMLVDKYNPNIKRDDSNTFNPTSFNPFKYFLNFQPKEVQKYRVDNTNYVIIVNPVK